MVSSLIYEGLVYRRAQCALIFETFFVVKYALSEGRNIEDPLGSGELSLSNRRHLSSPKAMPS